MTENTIQKIKAKIERGGALTKETKAELLSLVSTLESEVAKLSRTDPEHAESITGFVERSAHEATRQKPRLELLKISLAGLTESVRGFEASHPVLTANINNICTALAKMGI